MAFFENWIRAQKKNYKKQTKKKKKNKKEKELIKKRNQDSFIEKKRIQRENVWKTIEMGGDFLHNALRRMVIREKKNQRRIFFFKNKTQEGKKEKRGERKKERRGERKKEDKEE